VAPKTSTAFFAREIFNDDDPMAKFEVKKNYKLIVNKQRKTEIANVLKTAFFRVITQRVVVIPQPQFRENLSVPYLDALRMGPDRLYRNVRKKLPLFIL
jgi:hypothetical protein